MKNKSQSQEINWESEEEMMRQEKVWRKTLLPLQPLEMLEAYSGVIPTLPTILAECEEQKRVLEKEVIDDLLKNKAIANPFAKLINKVSLSVGVGMKLEKLERRISLLQHLISLTKIPSDKRIQSHKDFNNQIEIARGVSVETLVGTQVIKSGMNKLCLCPLHNETSASFTIYPNNRWYCFGCNQGGDSISLAMKMYNASFPIAVGLITGKFSRR